MELVLLTHLLRHDKRGVIQLREAVFGGQSRVVSECLRQVLTERLQYREDDLTARSIDRQSFEEVEPTVRANVVLLVKAVEVHHADQLLAVDRSFVEVLHVRAHRVVTIGHVQLEFLTLYTRGA